MSLYCPNTNSPEYIELVQELGEDNAIIEWDLKYGNKINEEKTFDEIEKVSNMIINKILTKEGGFYKKNGRKAKEDFFYNSEKQIRIETEKEIVTNVFKYFNSLEQINKLSDSELLQYLKNKMQELEIVKNEKYEIRSSELEKLYLIKRVIQNFSRVSSKEEISKYTEEQQNIIKEYFSKLFKENNYKTEKQALYHQSQIALKKINKKINFIQNNKSFLGINSIIKKLKVSSDFIEIIPNWRKLLNKKIENEYNRRLKYKTKNLQQNPDLQKTISFRELWRQSGFFNQELQFEKDFKFLSAHKKRIKSIFKDYDSSKEIMSSTNSVDVLTTISNENSEYKELAASLLNFAKKNNVEIVILNNKDKNVAGNYNAKIGQIENSKGENVASFIKNQIITIDGTSKRFAVNPEQLVLHEIVHSLSTIMIASEKNSKDNKSIFDKYLQYLHSKSKEIKDTSGIFLEFNMPYGFTNAEELFSEALTNPEFREMLKLIPPTESKNYSNFLEEFLDKVMELISKIFKKDNNYENALEQLEDLIYNTFEAQSNMSLDLENILKSLEGDIQDYKITTSNIENYQINYNLKSIEILNSDKATQIFEKGKKNSWDLNKILTELQVPKEQKQIILDKGIKDREDIITSLLAENSFVVEINTAKNEGLSGWRLIPGPGGTGQNWAVEYSQNRDGDIEFFNTEKEALDFIESKKIETLPTQHYSNLTVSGGTNYTENEIATPDITPNIKGHAQFSTDNGIGWFRSDDKNALDRFSYAEVEDPNSLTPEEFEQGKKDFALSRTSTKTRRILEVQSDLFQKGRDRKYLIETGYNSGQLESTEYRKEEIKTLKIRKEFLESDINESDFQPQIEKLNKELVEIDKRINALENIKIDDKTTTQNQFLQLLNKKNNWVTFFVKSIIQDSAKKGYEKVLFPKGDTAAKIEGHQTLEEFKKQKEARIKYLEENPTNIADGEYVNEVTSFNFNGITYDQGSVLTIKNGEAVLKDRDKSKKLSGAQVSEFFDETGIIPKKVSDSNEIKTLKQELADVESGQTQLSSIAKFYETTVANVLKKNGFNPIEITDEHGNKWNEVILEKEKDLSNIFLNKDNKTKFDGKYFKGDPKKLNKTELKRLFGISRYLKLSDFNISDIKGRIDKFNTRFKTSHKLPSYRIGQSNSYNIELIVDITPRNEEFKRQNNIRRMNPDNRTPKDQDIIDGNQLSFFSLENSSLSDEQKRKTKLANDRLEKILKNDLNVSIEFLRDFKLKYGVDANGVADAVKKLIEINNMEHLPEEAAHIIFEMISDSKLQEGLLNLARQSEEYKEVWKEYGETYNNDELKIAKETAGKLLAKAFIHTSENPVIINESENMIRRLIKSAEAIWKLIQKMLNSDPNIKTNLNEVFNDLAISIYSNNIELDPNKPNKRNVFFSKKADDNEEKVKETKSIVEEAIQVLITKIRVNKNKSTDEDSKSNKYVEKTKEILEGLEDDLENAKYVNAIQTAITKINHEFNANTDSTKPDSFQMKQKLDALEEQVFKNEISLNKLAKELRTMYQHYSSYKPIITKLINAINNDPEFKNDMLKTLSEEEYKNIETQVYIINGRLKYLEDKYYKLGSHLTTQYSDIYSKQKNKVRGKDGNLLSNTILVEDDTLLAKRTFAAAESNDELLRLIDSMNKTQKQIARNKHIELTTNVLTKYDKLKDKIKDFSYIAHKDKDGKLTGRFLTKKNDEKTYNKLSKDQKEYLDFLLDIKLEQEIGLPKRFRTGDLLPQYRKDLIERIKNDPKNTGNTILDLFRAREDDLEFGIKNELGEKVNFLPIYGTSKLEKIEDLSMDVTSTLLLHSMFIMEYKEMSKVIDALEMMKDLAGNRIVITSNNVNVESLKNKSVSEIKDEYDIIQSKTSHNFKWIEDFFKMQFYGQMKKDKEFSKSGNFKIPGIKMEFNWVKTLDTFGRYTGLNALGSNIFSGINNVVLGRLLTNIEALVGDFYNLKHVYSADKELANPMLLADVGKKIPTHKVHIWARYRNVMQQYESDVYNINADRKTKAGQLIDSNLPYVLASSGEFLIQMRSSIALAKSIKLKDKDGNKIDFYNAFDIVNNKMILKKGLKVDGKNKLFGYNRQGTEVTTEDVLAFERLQDRINQKLHGIYNNVDKSTVQQFALGRLAVMFRKFLVPTIRRRFGKAKFNEDMGETEEGYYMALLRFLGYQKEQLNMTRSQLLGLSSKENLTAEEEMQINNLRRSLIEIGTFLGLLVLTSFILDDIEPDDDDWALNMFIYQTNRLYTEIAAFTPSPLLIKEFTTIVKSPAAAVNQLEAISRLFNHVIDSDSWTEELNRGSYKGFTKLEKTGLQLLPMEKNIRSWFNPKEKNNWFDRN